MSASSATVASHSRRACDLPCPLSLEVAILLVKMSGFDADRVFSVSVHDVPEPTGPDSPSQTEKLLLEFLLQYRVGGDFIYRCVDMRLCVSRLALKRTLVTSFVPTYCSSNTSSRSTFATLVFTTTSLLMRFRTGQRRFFHWCAATSTELLAGD